MQERRSAELSSKRGWNGLRNLDVQGHCRTFGPDGTGMFQQEGPLSCLTNASPVDEDAQHNDNGDSDHQRWRVVCLAFCVGWAGLLYQRGTIRRVAPKKAGRFFRDWIVKFFHDAGCNSLSGR
jgi:hypothetical protein